jgi:putative transcriptional regulator|tara:strand:- start:757 stop:984 length:228 start_codon:yes stop_codon:yes gene_type:complete
MGLTLEKKLKVNLDLLLVQRKMTLTELSNKVDITVANLSKLKCDRAKAIRFSTLLRICEALNCKPGDLLELEETT